MHRLPDSVPGSVPGDIPLENFPKKLSDTQQKKISATKIDQAGPKVKKYLDEITNMEYKIIGQGKAKTVLKHENLEGRVFIIPNDVTFLDKIMRPKQQELKEEQATCDLINKKLEGKEGEKYLATDLEVHEKQIGGLLTYTTEEASGTLDGIIEDKTIGIETRLRLGGQFLEGLDNLHSAGLVHGDLKSENILVYGDKSDKNTLKLKISDFGKSVEIGEKEEKAYKGNLRHIPPEKTLSKSGEVFGAALILIQLLEHQFLDEDETKNLTDITNRDPGFDNKKHGLKGIEKFLCENKDCVQTLITDPLKRITFQLSSSSAQEKQTAEMEINRYIGVLLEKMGNKIPEDKKHQLGNLLRGMIHSDPTLRPLMSEVVEKYKAIFK